MTNPGGPQLLGMDVLWVATLLSVVAGIAVMVAIYSVVTVRDPMAKRVKALNDRREQLKAGITATTSKKRAKLVRNLADGGRHFEAVSAAFQLAGTSDESHRKRLANTDGSARGRHFNNVVRGEGLAVSHVALLCWRSYGAIGLGSPVGNWNDSRSTMTRAPEGPESPLQQRRRRHAACRANADNRVFRLAPAQLQQGRADIADARHAVGMA